jgi:acetyl esterase/lipase
MTTNNFRRRLLCLLCASFALPCVGEAAAPKPPTKPAPTKADISYGPHPHQLIDVYIPADGDGPFPIVLWFGGLWKPSKGAPTGNFLPSKCAVVAVQTRVMQDAIDAKTFPPVSVCLLDACRAVQFVRMHAKEWNLEPSRIAVGGGSQGALPALYVGCTADHADANSSDPVERQSSKVSCVAAYRCQPSIDPQQMQQWVPGVQWGAPALGVSFPESLKRRDELLPTIQKWSPDALVNKDSAPIYFENEWGLTRPDDITQVNYDVHSPRWGLGFQKIAQQRGATCYAKYPGHPTDGYADIWDFVRQQLGVGSPSKAGQK